MWFSKVFKNKNKLEADKEIDKFNQSANYLSENDLLFGKIKPIARQTSDGKFELAMDHVEIYIQNLGLTPDSYQALEIKHEYLLDAENVIKHSKAVK